VSLVSDHLLAYQIIQSSGHLLLDLDVVFVRRTINTNVPVELYSTAAFPLHTLANDSWRGERCGLPLVLETLRFLNKK